MYISNELIPNVIPIISMNQIQLLNTIQITVMWKSLCIHNLHPWRKSHFVNYLHSLSCNRDTVMQRNWSYSFNIDVLLLYYHILLLSKIHLHIANTLTPKYQITYYKQLPNYEPWTLIYICWIMSINLLFFDILMLHFSLRIPRLQTEVR